MMFMINLEGCYRNRNLLLMVKFAASAMHFILPI